MTPNQDFKVCHLKYLKKAATVVAIVAIECERVHKLLNCIILNDLA